MTFININDMDNGPWTPAACQCLHSEHAHRARKTTQNLNPQAMPAMSGKAILKHAHSLTQRGILNHGGVNGTGKPAHE